MNSKQILHTTEYCVEYFTGETEDLVHEIKHCATL